MLRFRGSQRVRHDLATEQQQTFIHAAFYLAFFTEFRLRDLFICHAKLGNFNYCVFLLLLFCHSVVSDSFVTPWTAARQAPLSSTISWRLLKFVSVKSVMQSNHFVLCHPLILLSSFFPSIRVFSNESALHI